MTDLPAPPPEPFLERDLVLPEQRKAPLWPALVVITALVLLTGLAFQWLRAEPPVKPAAAASVAPRADVNPCAGETFDANGCAVRMIQGASRQTGVPPYTVVKIWCSSWNTPKKQREMVDKWVAQGAPSREMARAVLDEILAYCPGMAK